MQLIDVSIFFLLHCLRLSTDLLDLSGDVCMQRLVKLLMLLSVCLTNGLSAPSSEDFGNRCFVLLDNYRIELYPEGACSPEGEQMFSWWLCHVGKDHSRGYRLSKPIGIPTSGNMSIEQKIRVLTSLAEALGEFKEKADFTITSMTDADLTSHYEGINCLIFVVSLFSWIAYKYSFDSTVHSAVLSEGGSSNFLEAIGALLPAVTLVEFLGFLRTSWKKLALRNEIRRAARPFLCAVNLVLDQLRAVQGAGGVTRDAVMAEIAAIPQAAAIMHAISTGEIAQAAQEALRTEAASDVVASGAAAASAGDAGFEHLDSTDGDAAARPKSPVRTAGWQNYFPWFK